MDVKIESSWKERLAEEFSKPYFVQLTEFVRREYAAGPCYPPGRLIFNAFNQTPFDQVKVVILGQDPYHEPGQAQGLCFSVPEGVPYPPSLVNILKEVEEERRNNPNSPSSLTPDPSPRRGGLQEGVRRSPLLGEGRGGEAGGAGNAVLGPWARQGVFLLNTCLTVRAHQAFSHSGHGWEQFTDAVIQLLARERENLVFMLWGAPAGKKAAFIDPSRHLILRSAHPSPLSAYRGFFGNHHFELCNQYLIEHGKKAIQW